MHDIDFNDSRIEELVTLADKLYAKAGGGVVVVGEPTRGEMQSLRWAIGTLRSLPRVPDKT